MSDLDFTGMSYDELTGYSVGELFNSLHSSDWGFHSNIPTEELMKITHVGKCVLYEAIVIADRQGNAEFFEAAFSFYGSLIDAALEEMDLPRRCTLCGAALPHTETAMAEHRATYGHHGELDQQGRRIPHHRSEDCTHDEPNR